MQFSIPTSGLLAFALLGSAARATIISQGSAPTALPVTNAPVVPTKARAERSMEARAGSIAAKDEPTKDALRIERFVLEAAVDEPSIHDASSRRSQARAASVVDKLTDVSSISRSIPKIIGAVEWRRLEHADGFQIECEILFARSGRDFPCQRVLHVEELCNAGARLIWREMGAGSGRSLLAEWVPGGLALRTVEWDKNETLREEISAQDGAVMPLYLIEMLRQGRLTTGRYPIFDPLSRALTDIELFTSYGDESSAIEAAVGVPADSVRPTTTRLRTVELLRTDGSLSGRYRFRGAELVAFQWQDGGPWARRATAGEYDAALAELSKQEPSLAKDP